MKIIEGMKELKLLEKRITDNQTLITNYASGADTEKPVFGDESKQKKEVQGLVDANANLVENYIKIKTQIEVTNLATIVDIDGKSYSIAALLLIKRKLGQSMIGTYKALNDRRGSNLQVLKPADGTQPKLVIYYDEKVKNDKVREREDFFHKIDGRLEVVNATTELVE